MRAHGSHSRFQRSEGRPVTTIQWQFQDLLALNIAAECSVRRLNGRSGTGDFDRLRNLSDSEGKTQLLIRADHQCDLACGGFEARGGYRYLVVSREEVHDVVSPGAICSCFRCNAGGTILDDYLRIHYRAALRITDSAGKRGTCDLSAHWRRIQKPDYPNQ